jgi:hypothetical protein
MISSYRELDVWKRSINLVKRIYVVTKEFPKDEIYGIVNQMRRCAISIPSNIAEGKTRQYKNECVPYTVSVCCFRVMRRAGNTDSNLQRTAISD